MKWAHIYVYNYLNTNEIFIMGMLINNAAQSILTVKEIIL